MTKTRKKTKTKTRRGGLYRNHLAAAIQASLENKKNELRRTKPKGAANEFNNELSRAIRESHLSLQQNEERRAKPTGAAASRVRLQQNEGRRSRDSEIAVLIEQHHIWAPTALKELTMGRKRTHWAWYIFPSEMPGQSDPFKTRVTKLTYNYFLDNIDVKQWIRILSLATDKTKIPYVDHGRIHYFCMFWRQFDDIPHELKTVIHQLNQIY
jgi:hypothetical protein